jgi:hypothetical protein
MLAKKTIKAKILELRKGKEELLKREYENFQHYLRGDKSVPLYSATRQQADRLLKRIGKPKHACMHILKRGIGELKKQSMLGACLASPKTSPMDSLNPMMRGEATQLVEW